MNNRYPYNNYNDIINKLNAMGWNTEIYGNVVNVIHPNRTSNIVHSFKMDKPFETLPVEGQEYIITELAYKLMRSNISLVYNKAKL